VASRLSLTKQKIDHIENLLTFEFSKAYQIETLPNRRDPNTTSYVQMNTAVLAKRAGGDQETMIVACNTSGASQSSLDRSKVTRLPVISSGNVPGCFNRRRKCSAHTPCFCTISNWPPSFPFVMLYSKSFLIAGCSLMTLVRCLVCASDSRTTRRGCSVRGLSPWWCLRCLVILFRHSSRSFFGLYDVSEELCLVSAIVLLWRPLTCTKNY